MSNGHNSSIIEEETYENLFSNSMTNTPMNDIEPGYDRKSFAARKDMVSKYIKHKDDPDWKWRGNFNWSKLARETKTSIGTCQIWVGKHEDPEIENITTSNTTEFYTNIKKKVKLITSEIGLAK